MTTDKQLVESNKVDQQELTREDKFIRNLSLYPTVSEAAIQAGYSQSYATSNLYQRLRKESFQRKIREFYKGSVSTLLPKIAQIESKVVTACLADVDKVPKFQHTLKQIKQSSGVLSQDTGQAQPTIQIESVRQLMIQIHESKQG